MEIAEIEVPVVKKPVKKKAERSKVKGLGLKQLLAKKYKMIPGLTPDIIRSFGELTEQILMIIYGPSGNGKSRLTMELVKEVLIPNGDVIYNALEEGHRRTMQKNVQETLSKDDHNGKIMFFDHTLTFDELVVRLKKRKSAKYIVIDSLQYWNIIIAQYRFLKETFPNKGFIFISHSTGKRPTGKLAIDIEYDVDIKVRVEGFVAFVKSRYGGNKPYIIWEEGAIKYWGKRKVNQFKK